MRRKKRADADIPIGTWSIHNGVITIMGITIAAALATAPTLRDLQVVELWSGVGSIVAAAEKHNYNTAAFDLNRVPGVTDVPGSHCEDITTSEGFKKAISLVLRLGPGALLALGPDCSSFTFPNSSRHKRHWGVTGDLLYGPVNVGNLMAVIALFLCQLALARGVHFALENPPDSHIFRFFESVCPDFMNMQMPDRIEESRCQGLHAQSVTRCPYDDSPEPKLAKYYKWLATWPGIKALNARCKCTGGVHRRLGKTTPDGVWTGNPQLLAESAAYPKRLGEALLGSWLKGSTAIKASWSATALDLVWVDPREEAPALKKATATSRKSRSAPLAAPNREEEPVWAPGGFGPWRLRPPGRFDANDDESGSREAHAVESGVKECTIWGHGVQDLGPWSTRQPNAVESRSQGVHAVESGSQGVQDLGPWSAAMPTTEGSLGPWSSHASAGSSSRPFSPWGSAMAATPAKTEQRGPCSSTLGPWGNAAPSISSEEDCDAEAAPGQIGAPWSDER